MNDLTPSEKKNSKVLKNSFSLKRQLFTSSDVGRNEKVDSGAFSESDISSTEPLHIVMKKGDKKEQCNDRNNTYDEKNFEERKII